MKTRYIFTQREGVNEVTVSFEARINTLDEVMTKFEDFLRASGFCFDGHVEIVNEEKDETPT